MQIRRDDNCDASDAEWGDFVSFCCADLGGGTEALIDVEIRVCDKAGNCNTLWSTVQLEDKDSFGTCPPDMVLSCQDDIWDFDITGGFGTAFTTCGPLA